ncbi:hypothetical protein P8610_18055 [Fictibacillus sp. UD]|uniref:hypothetical protein n=1 Tax=Fictibacillus sp. UD TaxID=3038777 RepID=UPI003746F874
MQITQESMFKRFPWAKPVIIELSDSDEGFFCDVIPWTYNRAQLNLIHTMLEEIENWFSLYNKPIEVTIFEFKEVQGHVFVEKICGFSEIEDIFRKYQIIYLGEE